MQIKRALALLALSSLAAAALAQVQYSVTELPPLPGYTSSSASGINDLGDIVGNSQPSANYANMATLWHAGVPSALGKAPKGNYSMANAINNSGQVTGDADDGSIRPYVVVFRGGKAIFIDSGANNSHGFVMLNNGQIVGDYLKGFGGTSAWNPTIWTEDSKSPGKFRHTFLPQFTDPNGGFANVFANGANNLGVVVGQVSSSTLWSSRAGMWSNDSSHTLTLLDPLPYEWDSYAFAINDSGTVAGISDLGVYSTTPVIWTGATHAISALPLLPGETSGYAIGINNLGQVIGTHGDAPAVWIGGELIDVQSALDASGAGWTIGSLGHINNLGQIVGTGTHDGKFRGFVLSPKPSP